MKPFLITCYASPDLDGVASVISYAEFLEKTGKKAIAGIFGQPHDEAKYMLDRFEFEYPKQLNNTSIFEKIVLVDSSDLNGLEGNILPERP